MKRKFILAGATIVFSNLAMSANASDLDSLTKRIEDLEKTQRQQESSLTGKVSSDGKRPVMGTQNGVDVKLYGDVEFNYDVSKDSSGIFDSGDSTKNYLKDDAKTYYGMNGRVLVGVAAEQKNGYGDYAGVVVEPLVQTNGTVGVDDAAVYFGHKDQWEIKAGRYESYDLFPLNNDTFVEYSAKGSDGSYNSEGIYAYRMREGRGRTNTGGGALFSGYLNNNWYFETNFLAKSGAELFKDKDYHGRKIEDKRTALWVRPVLAYTDGPFTFAAGVEANAMPEAFGYTDSRGQFISQSKRIGYGGTLQVDTLKSNPENGSVTNVSVAYLDASGENDFSFGVNNLWHNLELGYIYNHNNITNQNQYRGSNYTTGNYDAHTIHASYRFANVLDMPNFDAYLGAYGSIIAGRVNDKNDDKRAGVRARIKYYF